MKNLWGKPIYFLKEKFIKKMLESRLEDALVKLVKIVEIVETVKTVESVETVDTVETVEIVHRDCGNC